MAGIPNLLTPANRDILRFTKGPPASTKPRLYQHAGEWFCETRDNTDWRRLGYGLNPADAFADWARRHGLA